MSWKLAANKNKDLFPCCSSATVSITKGRMGEKRKGVSVGERYRKVLQEREWDRGREIDREKESEKVGETKWYRERERVFVRDRVLDRFYNLLQDL